MKFEPKKGDTVRVCYDGKWRRGNPGTVMARRGFAIKVSFHEYGAKMSDPNVDCWFVRLGPDSFGGYLRGEDKLMTMMFGEKDCPGDWYEVYDPKALD